MKFLKPCAALLIAILLLNINAFALLDLSKDENKDARQQSFLSSLGIMKTDSNGNFASESLVTRGEFAEIMCKMMNTNILRGTDGPFADVEKEHLYADYINTLASLGVMSGYNSATFGANDPIIYEHALKTVIDILGYKPMAEQRGGYPTGYIYLSHTLNLANLAGSGETLTKGAAARLVFNALRADVMTLTGVRGVTRYEVDKGTTLLTQAHDIYKIDGVVTETSESNPDAAISSSMQRKVTIDGVTLNADKVNAYDYLGYSVNAYYREDPNSRYDKELVFIAADTGRMTVTSVDRDDISDFDNFTIRYFSGMSGRTVKIPGSADVIYNGVFVKAGDREAVLDISRGVFNQGRMELVEVNGVLSCVKIYSYETYFIQDINYVTSKVYGKYNRTALNLEPNECAVTLKDMKGNDINLSSVTSGMTLNVYKSLNEKVIELIACNTAVSGTVSERDDSAPAKVVVDGASYEISYEYFNSGKYTLDVGSSYLLHLDAYGKISHVASKENINKFGFIIDVYVSSNLSKKIMYKMLADDGSVSVIEGTDRLILDENSETNSERILELLEERAELTQALLKLSVSDFGLSKYAQPVRYMQDINECITRIDTVFDEEQDTDRLRITYQSGSTPLIFKLGARCFAGKIIIDQNSTVLSIPYSSGAEDQDYTSPGFSYFRDDFDYSNIIALSSMPNSLSSEFILHFSSRGGSLNDHSKFGLVTGIKSVLNSNGETINYVELVANNALPGYNTSDMRVIKDVAAISDPTTMKYNVKVGDIIKYHTGLNGEMSLVQLAFDAGGDEYVASASAMGAHPDGYNYPNRLYYGCVYSKTDSILGVTIKDLSQPGTVIDEKTDLEVYDIAGVPIYTYQKDKGLILAASLSEVGDFKTAGADFSKVVINTASGIPKMMVIYD